MNLDQRRLAVRDARHAVAKGAACDLHARYQRAVALARGCEAIGDHVEAERFYQQADHYRRLLNSRAA